MFRQELWPRASGLSGGRGLLAAQAHRLHRLDDGGARGLAQFGRLANRATVTAETRSTLPQPEAVPLRGTNLTQPNGHPRSAPPTIAAAQQEPRATLRVEKPESPSPDVNAAE